MKNPRPSKDERLGAYLARLRLTSAQLARMVRRSYHTVAAWRAGSRSPGERSRAALAKVLKLSSKQLSSLLAPPPGQPKNQQPTAQEVQP